MKISSVLKKLATQAAKHYLQNRNSTNSSKNTNSSTLGSILNSVLSGTNAQDIFGNANNKQHKNEHTVEGTWREVKETVEQSPGRYGADATRNASSQELKSLNCFYQPNIDGDPDPGEVIWTWVPYIENDGRGKDRPVLIIGRIDKNTVAGCYLTSTYHQGFYEIGAGNWDAKRRVSYLNPTRVLRITNNGMRREAASVSAAQYSQALEAVRKHNHI